jgi:hypothetical protein
MNKPMDSQAKSLIIIMKHHLLHEYNSEENRQRNLDSHYKEFRQYESLPCANFSANVWDELNELFN